MVVVWITPSRTEMITAASSCLQTCLEPLISGIIFKLCPLGMGSLSLGQLVSIRLKFTRFWQNQ